MGADSLAKNTPNAPKFIWLSPKIWDFNEKRLHWVSVVHAQWLVGYKRSNEGCVKHLIISNKPLASTKWRVLSCLFLSAVGKKERNIHNAGPAELWGGGMGCVEMGFKWRTFPGKQNAPASQLKFEVIWCQEMISRLTSVLGYYTDWNI